MRDGSRVVWDQSNKRWKVLNRFERFQPFMPEGWTPWETNGITPSDIPILEATGVGSLTCLENRGDP